MAFVVATGGENFLPFQTVAFGVTLGAIAGGAIGWFLTPTGDEGM